MTALPRPDVDPDGLLEYSVVYTDRALNHMSRRFVGVVQAIVDVLTEAYAAERVARVPGGGSYAMESIARQLATGRRCLVVRNGLFSFRWSAILERRVSDDVTVCKARPLDADDVQSAWAPAPIDEVEATIAEQRPEVVFAPHVETAAGMILPDDYLARLAAATHAVGGLFVLDCIASGAAWVDMRALGVDVLVSAPQKGWSGSPGVGFVMLTDAAAAVVQERTGSSFSLDLARWLDITDGYRDGRHAYHTTMPTDAMATTAESLLATRAMGFARARAAQEDLGARVRALLVERGYPSVAAPGFEAPGVVVVHTSDPEQKSGAAFARVGVQAAGGVPLQCDEPAGFSTFRIGLFGLDKLGDVDGTVERLARALDRLADAQHA